MTALNSPYIDDHKNIIFMVYQPIYLILIGKDRQIRAVIMACSAN